MEVDIDGTVLKLTRRWGELVGRLAGGPVSDDVAPMAGGERPPRTVIIEFDARATTQHREACWAATTDALAKHGVEPGVVRIRFIGGAAGEVRAAIESAARQGGFGHAVWEWWQSKPTELDDLHEHVVVVADGWRGAPIDAACWEADLASGKLSSVACWDTPEQIERVVQILERGLDVAVKLRPRPKDGAAKTPGDGVSRLAPYVSGDLASWEPWGELMDRILCESRRILRLTVGPESLRIRGAPANLHGAWGESLAGRAIHHDRNESRAQCRNCRFSDLGCAKIDYSYVEDLWRQGASRDAEAVADWFCKAKTAVHIQVAYVLLEHLREQNRLKRLMVEFPGKGLPLRFSH